MKKLFTAFKRAAASALLFVTAFSCYSDEIMLFYDDFGTFTSETARAQSMYVPAPYKYKPECTPIKYGGDYAVVANSKFGGCGNQTEGHNSCDCTYSYWYRSSFDHTQRGPMNGIYGGMLFLNSIDNTSTDADVLYQRTFETEHTNTLLKLHLWVKAAWDMSLGNNLINITLVLREGGAKGDIIDQQEIHDINANYDWVLIENTFRSTSSTITVQIINSTINNTVSNDILIDDIEIYEITYPDAEPVAEPVEDVIANPTETSVELTWPSDENANTYVIQLTNSGEEFCTMVFNSEGRLISIHINQPTTKNGPVLKAADVNGGFRFTIDGLTEDTEYAYNISSNDVNSNLIHQYTGEFLTLGGTVTITEESITESKTSVHKEFLNGKIVIINDGKIYNLMGVELR